MKSDMRDKVKRFVAALTALLIVGGGLPAEIGGARLFDTAVRASAADPEPEEFKEGDINTAEGKYMYIVLDDGTAEITKYERSGYSDVAIIIPDTLGGHTVSSIGERAFAVNSYDKYITIPKSVTSIGKEAFTESWFTNITFADGSELKTIGKKAFSHCSYLESLNIPEGVESIGDYAFEQCNALKSIIIPGSVKNMGIGTFDWCSNLESVEFKKGITAISDSMFSRCDMLKNVTIPDSVTSIGASAFCDCDGLESITIPDSVTSIGSSAFRDCHLLQNIDLGNGVKTIETGTFQECNFLKEITIPAGVTKIETHAFHLSINLEDVNILSDDIEISDKAFEGSSVKNLTARCKKIHLLSYAFFNCYAFETVDIKSDVVIIEQNAIDNTDDNILNVSIIGKEITLCPEALNTRALPFLTIRADSVNIEEYAFYKCQNIHDFYLYVADPANITGADLNHGFRGSKLTKCHVPQGTAEAYRTAFPKANLTFVDDLLYGKCGENAYWELTDTDGDNEPDKLTISGTGDMYDYYSSNDVPWKDYKDKIKTAEIAEGITSIGIGAFSYCTELTSVTIPEGIKSIGIYAFQKCAKLTDIALPDSVTKIGDYAFEYCQGLKNINIPESTESIGTVAFHYCTSLESIELPAGVTSIEEDAFKACDHIKDVYLNVTDPSKLTWNENNCDDFITYNGNTKCHVPKGTLKAYNDKFGETVNVTFVVNDCAVSIDNNIKNGTVTADKTTADAGDEITLTITPDSHYKLKSLTVEDVAGNPVTVTDEKFTMPDNDVTITAEFEQISYTLQFDANGGSGTIEARTVFDGEMFTFPECTFTPPDEKQFLQWNMSGADGVYVKGSTIEIASNCALDGVITVNPIWKAADTALKTAPAPSAITYGQSLADSTLTGGEVTANGKAVKGTFEWVDDTIEPAVSDSESTEYAVTFTPDNTDLAPVNTFVKVQVSPAEPTVTAPTASAITYGQTLAGSTLSGGSASFGGTDIAGTFTWKDKTIAPAVSDSDNTEYDVIFTPTSGNYAAKKVKVKLTVDPAEPTVTAPTASAITYGQTLADSTLSGGSAVFNGTAVEGTFAWKESTTKPAVSDSDTTEYDVTFTPSSANFNSAEMKVKIKVNPAGQTVTTNGYNGAYDGNSHGITVTPADTTAKVYYSETELTAENYTEGSAASPRYSKAGTHKVYYYVDLPNHAPVSGSENVEIAKANVTVTITGHNNATVYDGSEHTVSGYDTAISNALYTSADFTFTGKADAKRTNAGTTDMGLSASDFANNNDNFNATFDVTDGYQIITAKQGVTVTVTGKTNTAVYDEAEHTVSGYDVSFSDPLYTAADFTFTGTAEAKQTNAGKAAMGLTAEQFSNNSSNFTGVTFAVTDGYQEITAKEVTSPTVELEYAATEFDDTEKKPTVTVWDGETKIPETEYTVSYSENVNTGTAKVTVTDKDGGNYIVGNGTVTFEITKAPQNAPDLSLFTISNETISGKKDGKIEGLTDKMEFGTSGTEGFAAAGTSVENLAPGTYYVRFAEDENHTVSEATALTIAAGRKLAVRFVNDDGTELQSSEYEYNETPEYSGEIPAKAADAQYTYTFKGWDNEIGSVTADTTYTATYDGNKKSYTITFDTDGGTEIAPVTLEWGTALTAPANPTKDGYIFKGWDTEIPATMPAENVTIKAKWVTNEYIVTVNDAAVNDVEWVHGSTTPLLVVVNGTPDDTLTFDYFEQLIIDGTTVDPSNYTGEKGSLKLTINADYLNTLSVGEHTMQIVFRDNTAECRLTILPEPDNTPPLEKLSKSNPAVGSISNESRSSGGAPAGDSTPSPAPAQTADNAPAPTVDAAPSSDNPATGTGDPLGALALATAASLAALDLISKKRKKED